MPGAGGVQTDQERRGGRRRFCDDRPGAPFLERVCEGQRAAAGRRGGRAPDDLLLQTPEDAGMVQGELADRRAEERRAFDGSVHP